MSRPRFKARTIILKSEAQRPIAIQMVENMPLDTEIVGREITKARKPDQNAQMWAGPLRDMAASWIGGKAYSEKTWHNYFKELYLPENDDPDLARLVKDPETYRKWEIDFKGDRQLIGSTTDLSPYGFGQYVEQIYAFGSDLGVRFSAPPNRLMAA